MPNTPVPVCPFISSAGNLSVCLDNCPLNLDGQCSIKVIAQVAQSSNPTSKTNK